MIDVSAHPILFLYDLLNSLEGSYTFNFSRYFYRPQSPIDEREIIRVGGDEINNDWLTHQVQSLKEGWEIALNSEVIDHRNRTFHIPMIDFSGKDESIFFSGQFRDVLGRRHFENIYVYDSGRSYHSYALMLMGGKAWVEFMGGLLILNLPSKPAVIDSRWVGHRLISGYSALRWSCHSEHYLDYPKFMSKRIMLGKSRGRDYFF